MPLKESKALDDGWTKIGDCSDGSPFRGRRYVLDGDYSVVLIYNAQEKIAGIQAGILKSDTRADYPPTGQRGKVFQEFGGRWYLTAYFQHPGSICSAEQTISGLYIEWGSDAVQQSRHTPDSESDLASTQWMFGKCFWAMGNHYWYDYSADMNCDDFQPLFLLYNKGKLNGFGWALAADMKSDRWEHPPPRAFSKFFDPVPQCLHGQGALSTMHVYLTSPYFNFC